MDERRATGPRLVDAVAVAVVSAAVLLGTPHLEAAAGQRPIDAGAYALGLAGAASLPLSRRWPAATAVIACATVFGYLAAGYPGGPALLVGPIAMALVGFRARRWAAAGAATGMSLAVVAGSLIATGGLPTIGVAGPAWAVAFAVGGQALAARVELRAAERERRERRELQARSEQRLEIARDLHDSVAHAMATISVQSGVAAHLLDRRPEQARAALEAIREASADALDELGAILAALRGPGGAPESRDVPAGPDRVRELLVRARADGLVVDEELEGDLAAPAPSVGAAAYRVVQESLSNAVRHAPGARVTVRIRVDGPRSIAVEVVDGGPAVRQAPARPGGGFGLVGMRERVTATGGSFAAGPAGGGFRVSARWPAVQD
ncbi:sensor histidine kinase [Tsukamurella sp. 1534]|uniref:sensor histidine kinase n=1 Tax=Tsukamurella sp. 1534 TaxID=1151061 RepID=UPI0002FA3BCE|nr:sensor histidine kinase [Tsukamurella sp. 1534]